MRIAWAALLVVLPGLSGADTTAGAQFLNVPLSVRQMGMGGVSAGGHDLLRAWTNPAALADRERRGELALGGSSMFGGDQSTFGFGAGWMLNPNWSVGALLSSFKMSISQVDAGGENAGIDLTRGTQAGGVATAVKLGFARVGVAVKTVTDTVVGDRASSVAADVGVSAEWNLLSASVAYRNLGGALRTGNAIDAPDEVLPAELRGGLALRYPGRPIVVAAEAAQVAGLKGRVAVGVEWWPVAAFGIRAGTADLGEAVARITAGLSASWKGVALDYARVSHPVGVTHTASLSFAFGPTSSELANSQASARTAREAELAAAPAPVESAPAVVPEAALPVAATPTPAPRPSGRSTLAVAAFDPQNVSAGDAAVIADMFRAELVKQGRFDIIEKVNMDKILAEQAFQQSGCTTAECAVKLGKILNVRYLIVGSFGKLMDQYVLNIRMVETESAKVIYSDAVGELSTQRAVQKAIAAMTTRLGKAYGSK